MIKIAKYKSYRDQNGKMWTIVAQDEGFYVGMMEKSVDCRIFNYKGVSKDGELQLLSIPEGGTRWMNVYEWKKGSDSDNGGTAPSTVHWWKEDADSSAKFRMLGDSNLIRVACIKVNWKNGEGL